MEETKKEKITSKQKMNLNIGGLGISSFFLSLISIEYLLIGVFVHNPFYFSIFSIPAAMLSIIFGILDRKINESTLPIIGIVIGLIVLALYIVYFFTILLMGVENFNFSF